jgi:hypothetical protein
VAAAFRPGSRFLRDGHRIEDMLAHLRRTAETGVVRGFESMPGNGAEDGLHIVRKYAGMALDKSV